MFDCRLDPWTGKQADKKVDCPTPEQVASYATHVTTRSKMENEIPIIALVYIERILSKRGVLINRFNWKRMVLSCLCIASKVWDDDSLENQHFPQVLPEINVDLLNKLEVVILDNCLDYDLVVKGSEYAKYYFITRTLAEELVHKTQATNETTEPPKKKKFSASACKVRSERNTTGANAERTGIHII